MPSFLAFATAKVKTKLPSYFFPISCVFTYQSFIILTGANKIHNGTSKAGATSFRQIRERFPSKVMTKDEIQ